MQYYINEWFDLTASLIADEEYSLDIFESIDDAINACVFDCMLEPEHIETDNNYSDVLPIDFESSSV